MYKIGEFSKITDTSIRTLRYYDNIDILKPSYVDNFTNYRYYTDDDKLNLEYIKYLKSLGYSLEEILLYKDNMNVETIDNKIMELEEKRFELNNMIEELYLMKERKVKILNKSIQK